jgi:hypothetical protein
MTTDAESERAATPELAALTNVVRALQGLSAEGQRRVVESALVFLGTKTTPIVEAGDLLVSPQAGPSEPRSGGLTDIRSLKEQKNPGSANEMAALVAYYLAEVAQGSEKKPAIDISDVEKYFKQANFRLPRHPKMTLVNARNAGYFDAVGSGQYKLNPVGYNLVAHSLPRAGTAERLQKPKRPAGRTGRIQQRRAKKRPSRPRS